MVIGLDVHKKESVGFVVDGDPDSGEWFTVKTTSEHLEQAIPQLMGHTVLIEASTSGKAVARFLKNRGVDVDLVQADVLTGHIRYTKTDKLDARDLARIGLLGGYKTCYIATAEEEELRALVRHVHDLRKQAARIKNQAKAVLQRNLVPEPMGNLRNLHVRQRWRHLDLPDAERAALASKLDILERLHAEDADTMVQVCRLVRDHPALPVLVSFKGVDVYTAAVVIAFCGDMTRFPEAKKIASFSGLTPKNHQSGGNQRHGRITRRGPNVLRHALVEAAHNVVRHAGRLKNKYQRLAARIGKGKAIVAIARTLITAMWRMVINNTPYDGADDELAEAKTWRVTTVARLAEEGELDRAKRLLATYAVKRAHGAWKRGTSQLVPAT